MYKIQLETTTCGPVKLFLVRANSKIYRDNSVILAWVFEFLQS